MSTGRDFQTGGADSVFTRVLTNVADAKKSDRAFRFVVKPEELGRQDWYAFNADKYGNATKRAIAERITPAKIMDEKYRMSGGNEVMFQKGIPLSSIERVVTNSSKRTELLAELQRRGIKTINGQAAEKFIVEG